VTRRRFLGLVARGGAAAGAAWIGFRTLGAELFRPTPSTVWQIDPDLCIGCDRCRTACVLLPSAVKCVQAYSQCGYCDLCGGYFQPKTKERTTGAENQVCPTGAIKRTFVEDPYFEYKIVEDLCVGCAKCVVGCAAFGNASLFLQIKHDRCVGCNECAIMRVCPAKAIARAPRSQPYKLRQHSVAAGEEAGGGAGRGADRGADRA
jgi:electron transport complex protein RnfB